MGPFKCDQGSEGRTEHEIKTIFSQNFLKRFFLKIINDQGSIYSSSSLASGKNWDGDRPRTTRPVPWTPVHDTNEVSIFILHVETFVQ